MTTIFFDLDGPILDVSERYYRVHSHITDTLGYPVCDKSTYWEMKRKRRPIDELLYLDKQAETNRISALYSAQWLQLIETEGYLAYNEIVPGVLETLEILRERYSLVLVTLRRFEDNLNRELARLGIKSLFNDILCDHSKSVPGWVVKKELILGKGPVARADLMVGDTEIDILAGRELGITTVAVLNGIRAPELLEETKPDFLIPDIMALPRLLRMA